MSTNVSNLAELRRVTNHVGVVWNGDGYNFAGASEVSNQAVQLGEHAQAVAAMPAATEGHDLALAVGIYPKHDTNGLIGAVVNASADEPPLHHSPALSIERRAA